MYKIPCPTCKLPFNVEKAADCDCIEPLRTFRCPNCAACFCKAPQQFRREFWANATRELWDRRKKINATADSNPPPEEISHPVVLFADDDAVGRGIASRVIASMGVSIVVAANGDEALQLARAYKPDLLITDALMPKMDGRELGRIVKGELPSTRVVVISGLYKDARYKTEAIRNFNVDDFLPKPIAPAELRAVVQKYVTAS